MGKDHLLRIAAPKSWAIKRKTDKFIARPMPGPHGITKCLTLNFILRHSLEYVKTTKELKLILTNKEILVDKKVRRDYKFPVGLMDVIEIPKLKEQYRVIYDLQGKLKLLPITSEESKVKPIKVINKVTVKKGKIQLTFHDGRTLLLEKTDAKVGDTAIFDLEKSQVKKWIKLNDDTLAYISGGSYIGSLHQIKKILRTKDLEKTKAIIEVNGMDQITLAEYVFPIGKDKSEVKLQQ